MSQDDPDYEVGYGKPPKESRFKKGKSGNPKGRPKTSRNTGKMLEDVFYRKIPITEGGKRRDITVMETIFRQVANGAAKGEVRHVDRFLKLLPLMHDAILAEQLGEDRGQVDPQADRDILAAMAAMFGSDSEHLFASLQEGPEK